MQTQQDRQDIIQRVAERFCATLSYVAPEMIPNWIAQELADFANDIQECHAEDMQARLQYVLDQDVVREEGVYTFPDGNRWRCQEEATT